MVLESNTCKSYFVNCKSCLPTGRRTSTYLSEPLGNRANLPVVRYQADFFKTVTSVIG